MESIRLQNSKLVKYNKIQLIDKLNNTDETTTITSPILYNRSILLSPLYTNTNTCLIKAIPLLANLLFPLQQCSGSVCLLFKEYRVSQKSIHIWSTLAVTL